jgi:hypothetical protein
MSDAEARQRKTPPAKVARSDGGSLEGSTPKKLLLLSRGYQSLGSKQT